MSRKHRLEETDPDRLAVDRFTEEKPPENDELSKLRQVSDAESRRNHGVEIDLLPRCIELSRPLQIIPNLAPQLEEEDGKTPGCTGGAESSSNVQLPP